MRSFAVQLLDLIMLSMMNYCRSGYEHTMLYLTSSTKPRNIFFVCDSTRKHCIYTVDKSQDGSHVKYRIQYKNQKTNNIPRTLDFKSYDSNNEKNMITIV